jgi:hypothetical protein
MISKHRPNCTPLSSITIINFQLKSVLTLSAILTSLAYGMREQHFEYIRNYLILQNKWNS